MCQANLTGMKNRVRELREKTELSQGQLADAVDVSRQTINSIEQERDHGDQPEPSKCFAVIAAHPCRHEVAEAENAYRGQHE